MTERIKLENPGDELTLTVASVSPEDIGGYSYWKISDGAKEFAIPQKSLDAQIDRAGVATAPEMVGRTIKFSRSIKLSQHKKPYWNLDLVGNGTPVKADLPPLLRDAEAQDNAALAAKVGVDLSPIERNLAVYQGIAEWASRTLPPIFNAGNNAVGMTPESLAACVNTLYINAAGKK